MKQIRMPTGFCRYSRIAGLMMAVGLICQSLLPAVKAHGLGPDILYVGDESDDTVKSFDADTGASLDGANGAFITQSSGDLHGPRGLLIAGPELVVVNQNEGQPSNGEISQYQLKNGSFTGPWVSKSDPNAPFLPRGAALKNGVLYVANFLGDDSGAPGAVLVFAGYGGFLGELTPPAGGKPFYPRGVVVGPDDLLYVSSDPNPGGTGGQVLRFDPNTLKYIDVFINDTNDIGNPGHLNRPEGLVFDPDGKKLYITSFAANTRDTDSIRIYHATGAKGVFLDKIELDKVGRPRAFAQALLFGPLGNLFVPTSTGQVLRCDVVKKICNVFVKPGTLGLPFYLTFGRTDPATLAYPDQ